jgi:hypothetical protein
MKKRAKPSPEFDNFTVFMDKLANVRNDELKKALEEEKQEKARLVKSFQDHWDKVGEKMKNDPNWQVPY